MLIVLLYASSARSLSDGMIAVCCIVIFIANIAVLFLLEQMEQAARTRERLLALDQQLQIQIKNMEAASNLYAAQRKKFMIFVRISMYLIIFCKRMNTQQQRRILFPLKNFSQNGCF